MAMEDEDIIIIGFGGAFFRLFHLFSFRDRSVSREKGGEAKARDFTNA